MNTALINTPLQPTSSASRRYDQTRLLLFGPQGQLEHTRLQGLAQVLQPGDLLVLNRSATLPGSFCGSIARSGAPLELRLAAFQGPSAQDLRYWQAVSFGSGDWRQPTETRGSAPKILAGDRLIFSEALSAEVLTVDHERLLQIRFESPDLLPALYAAGQPIQYAYHSAPLTLWDQQTVFAGPPISAEPPSASFALNWQLLLRWRAQGVQLATLLHSAGLSSTGDAQLDAHLPLAEWYELPTQTVAQIAATRQAGRRIIAVGTTVLRTLEAAAANTGGQLRPGAGLARLKIQPGHRFAVVNALLTGMHEPGSSHLQILDSLCPLAQIQQGYREAAARGYLGHEYGDLSFLSCA